MPTDDELEAAGYMTKRAQVSRPWRCRADTPGCTAKHKCISCRGRANRRKGKVSERVVRKDLEKLLDKAAVRTQGAASIGEEAWHGIPVRAEVKAGKQVSKRMVTMFEAGEKQSEDQRAVGDNRPFMFVAEPDGWSDGLIVIRRSNLRAVLEALTE